AIVNEAFAKQFFDGANPVGRTFERVEQPRGPASDLGSTRIRLDVVGLIRDARSRDDLRLPIRPTIYIPFASTDAAGGLLPAARGTFVVRTSSENPLALASILRQEVPRARSEFRVINIRTQQEISLAQTVRERLLAMLAMFFAGVALLL